MDHIELVPQTRGSEEGTWEVAEVIINHRPLVSLLHELELPFAEAEGDFSLAGRYDGLPAKLVFYPSRYYLGDPSDFITSGYPLGKRSILGCSCGEVDCWPFLARIVVSEDTITWTEFENFFRGPNSPERRPIWTYKDLGDMVFNRAQYESALRSHVIITPEKPPLRDRLQRHRCFR